MAKPRTHSQYIESFPVPVRRLLQKLRALIRKEAPDAEERISYGVAAFFLNGPLVYIAGFKNHVSFFPTSSGIREFKTDLAGYKTSAGTVQFDLDEPLPLELLRRMVRFRLSEARDLKTGRSLGAQKKSLVLRFQSRLERIADGMEYYALPVPVTISKKIGIRGAVPVMARVNDSDTFRGSLFPVGEGRHFMRVKASVRKQAGAGEGDRVRVEITVLDRSKKDALPKDLKSALRESSLLEAFDSIPPGRRNYLLRWVDQAAKPETRKKRILAALEEARRRKD